VSTAALAAVVAEARQLAAARQMQRGAAGRPDMDAAEVLRQMYSKPRKPLVRKHVAVKVCASPVFLLVFCSLANAHGIGQYWALSQLLKLQKS
jgi:hypothetical protein